ncbi:MAG: hypothetical protein KC635_08175 [Myxococcales bacterium]|nr:hypothetical protein [Myxococcales bacterium]MCB9731561.1 hypothetical protein [Deltaproteobacteria bacterium]
MQSADVSRVSGAHACPSCGGPTRKRGRRCETCDARRAEQSSTGSFASGARAASRPNTAPKARPQEPRRFRVDTRPGLGNGDPGQVVDEGPVPQTRRAHPAMIRSALAEAHERSTLPPTAAPGARAEAIAKNHLVDGGRAHLRDERPVDDALGGEQTIFIDDDAAVTSWRRRVSPYTLVLAGLTTTVAVLALVLALR